MTLLWPRRARTRDSRRIAPFLAAALSAFFLLRTSATADSVFRCSAKGGSVWHEYRTKHFLVDTDVTGPRAEGLIKDLETIQALIVQALLGEQVEIPGRVRVIAFGDPSTFRDLAGDYYVGGYFGVTWLEEPTIVLPVTGLQASPETVAHELAHHISWFLFPRQPRWFSEGLASFVQTVATESFDNAPRAGSHVVRGQRGFRGCVGLMPSSLTDQLPGAPLVPVKELLEWRGREDPAIPGRYHVWSWLLYHWLWNNRSKQFTDYQRRLSNAEDPALAWRAAFPEFDPAKPGALDQLEKTLQRYRISARYVFYRVNASADSSFSDTILPSADTHLLLLQIRRVWPPKEEGVALRRAELAEALQEDPSQPLAIVERATLDKTSPLRALRAAAEVRPNDWRAWFLLGEALIDGIEKEAAYRKAVQLNPDSASAQNSLALVLATSGRSKEALPIANRAVDLAPWNPHIIDTLAMVAADLGKCSEALVLGRRAQDLLEPEDSAANRIRKRIREYEQSCAAKSRR